VWTEKSIFREGREPQNLIQSLADMDNAFRDIVDKLKGSQSISGGDFAYLLERGDKDDC